MPSREKNREYRMRYIATAKGRMATRRKNARWRKTDAAKAYFSKPEVKAKLAKYAADYRKRHPEKVKARLAVSHAKRRGDLVEPTTLSCAHCALPAKGYHHHKGYAREHWLDVIPLCKLCHCKVDGVEPHVL